MFRCAAWNRLCIFSSFLGYIFNKILQKYKFIFFRANTCFTDFIVCLLKNAVIVEKCYKKPHFAAVLYDKAVNF